MKERDSLGVSDVDGRMTLKFFVEEQAVMVLLSSTTCGFVKELLRVLMKGLFLYFNLHFTFHFAAWLLCCVCKA